MRVYRQRIRSVQATKKITRAMELIAASRVVKARQRVVESGPYTHALTRALSALAEYSNEAHALITEKSEIKRAAEGREEQVGDVELACLEHFHQLCDDPLGLAAASRVVTTPR